MAIYRASCSFDDDEYEYFYESDADTWAPDMAARELIRHMNVFVHRSKPQAVDIKVERFYAKDGLLQSHKLTTINQKLPFLSLTETEYNQAMTELLAGLKPNTASFIRNKAWDDCHSSGYDSVLSAAKDLVEDMRTAGLLE